MDRFLFVSSFGGHLMEKIEAGNALHRAFSVFLFNSKYELLLQKSRGCLRSCVLHDLCPIRIVQSFADKTSGYIQWKKVSLLHHWLTRLTLLMEEAMLNNANAKEKDIRLDGMQCLKRKGTKKIKNDEKHMKENRSYNY